MYASTPGTLPRLFSHPRLLLTANGLSKWPIAESLCNYDQISHVPELKSNCVVVSVCAEVFEFTNVCVCPKKKSDQ